MMKRKGGKLETLSDALMILLSQIEGMNNAPNIN